MFRELKKRMIAENGGVKMERQGLISPFQLTVLLFLSRLFTIMTYVPAMEGQEKNGLVLLLGLLVSPLAQMALLGLGCFLPQRQGKFPLVLFCRWYRAAAADHRRWILAAGGSGMPLFRGGFYPLFGGSVL